MVEGVSGRYFEDNQEAEIVAGGGNAGVAAWSVDPQAADRLGDYATAYVQ